jgi:nucleoside-diphosphate-sugar epimerase
MSVLVTGGSGHLGANLVRRLIDDGIRPRVLEQPGSDNGAFDGLDVERVTGDLRDPSALDAAVRGIERVYHCAAKISTVRGGEQEIFDINVIGTKNLLAAARAAKVKRVVVSGSFSAVGHLPDRPSDETVPFNPFTRQLPYSRTKVLVELECWKAVADGLDVVVATSCAILGPADYMPSRMGRTLIAFAEEKMPAYIPGGFEFVAARDIVEGHILCMEKGRVGQKYIFGSGFVTVDELMETMSQVTGKRKPRFRLPPPVMSAIANVASPIMTRFFPKKEQRLTPDAVRLLTLGRKADCTKAKTELGYVPTSAHDAIREAYADFVRRGVIHDSRPHIVSPPSVKVVSKKGSNGEERLGA